MQVSFQLFDRLFGRLLPDDVTVIDNGRRNRAGSDATHGQERELAVRSCFSRLDSGGFFNSRKDLFGSFDVTGSTEADDAGVNALRLKSKEVVEGRDTVNAARGNMQSFRHKLQCLFVQVPEGLLDDMECFNQGMALLAVAPHLGIHNFPTFVLRWEGGLGCLHLRSVFLPLLEPWNHWLFGILQRGDSETIHPKSVGDKERLVPFFG